MAEPEPAEPKNKPDKTPSSDSTASVTEPDHSNADSPDDPVTDKVVDDITRTEGDDELKAQDEAAGKTAAAKQGGRFKEVWRNWWHSPAKRWGTVAAGVVIVATLFAVPLTRYEVLGLFIREKVTVQVLDSQTGTAVSGAQVQLGAVNTETDGEGKAVLHPHTGSRHLQISKKYYGSSNQTLLVTLSPASNVFKVKLVALGRRVPVKVVNKLTGKPVAGAKIMAGATTAKTDKNGLATVVLQSGAGTQAGTVSLGGYNDTKVTIDANGNLTKDTFDITPAGKLYFLSNLSGSIDVVKTNLDGTARQTVLAGTGNEDRYSTSLLASRDWKYLALLSKRSGDNASVYLIDTTNGDKLSTIDEGNANFSLVGWSGDRFIYEVDRSPTISNGQKNKYALKSFDPTTGHTLLLDQTDGSTITGNPDPGWVDNPGVTQQTFNGVYLLGSSVVYLKQWYSTGYKFIPGQNSGLQSYLNGKSAELDTIGADGSNHKVVKTFAPNGTIYVPYPANNVQINLDSRLYEPQSLYLAYSDDNGNTTYYDYEDGKVTDAPDVTRDVFDNTPYPTYLTSPSGNQTFWADQRDGKNLLNVGDIDGKDPKQVGNLTDYNPYGWYGDSYLLVSKNSSELYVIPATGGTPLKITDYYKPAISYYGYGGGYGGL